MTNDKNKQTVTDEMVEAGRAAIDAFDDPCSDYMDNGLMRAALEAASAVQPKPALSEDELRTIKAARLISSSFAYEPTLLAIIDRLTGEKP